LDFSGDISPSSCGGHGGIIGNGLSGLRVATLLHSTLQANCQDKIPYGVSEHTFRLLPKHFSVQKNILVGVIPRSLIEIMFSKKVMKNREFFGEHNDYILFLNGFCYGFVRGDGTGLFGDSQHSRHGEQY
jgi:hypothetical protein